MQYFSAETFRFLDDLNAHRDKAWFEWPESTSPP